MAKITGLTIYPVKSCRGIDLKEANLAATGLEYDRQWMIVDEEHRFLTQRTLPRMALIHTALTDTNLVLTAVNQPELIVPIEHQYHCITVRVWDDICDGQDAGDNAAVWLSAFLNCKVRLVRFNPAFQRISDKQYTGEFMARNAYADGFPILLISQASLNDLNDRLITPLPMNRFRPNIVIDGIGAFEEDYIAQLSAPGLRLKPVKPCARCEITTTDQDTGMRSGEPLLTLSTYRNNEQLQGIIFGQNVVIVEGIGQQLCVGDELAVEWNF
ncbi:MAG: MOSC N-terminal beta barrel domain-containing protein [Pseudomonadota bacterium]